MNAAELKIKDLNGEFFATHSYDAEKVKESMRKYPLAYEEYGYSFDSSWEFLDFIEECRSPTSIFPDYYYDFTEVHIKGNFEGCFPAL